MADIKDPDNTIECKTKRLLGHVQGGEESYI